MAFDTDKNALLVAESGVGGGEPRILGFSYADGVHASPSTRRARPSSGLRSNPFRMYGPIGGMAVRDGVIYVSHRDKNDFGVISALTYDGKGTTVVAGLPAQGDHGVTDVVFGPVTTGSTSASAAPPTAASSGSTTGTSAGSASTPSVADRPFVDVRSRGPPLLLQQPPRRACSPAPSWRSPRRSSRSANTSAACIDAPRDGKPNAAIYSVLPTGGVAEPDLRVEAHGIRLPAGLAFEPGGSRLYTTNQGMELRGTRPVLDDPNTVLLRQPRAPSSGTAGPTTAPTSSRSRSRSSSRFPETAPRHGLHGAELPARPRRTTRPTWTTASCSCGRGSRRCPGRRR